MSLSRFLFLGINSFLLTAQLLLGAPVITQVSPNRGPAAGGTSVTITGSGFTGVTQVNFGPTTATFTFNSDTEITATAPQSVPGTLDISVTAGSDTSPTTPADRFTYQGNWFAYVSAGSEPRAWYIDLGTLSANEITLTNQGTPNGIAITPNGRVAYVGDASPSMGNSTYVNSIDLANNTPTPIQCSGYTQSDFVAISPDGTSAFCTFHNNNAIGQIDVATNTFTGKFSDTGSTPEGIAISPDGNTIYVANFIDSTISAISGGGQVTITLPTWTWYLAITPDGSEVYVTSSLGENIYVIDTALNTLTKTITISGARTNGIAITPDGSYVYVTQDSPATVYQISTATKTVNSTIDCGNGVLEGISIAPDGQKAYVVDQGNSNVIVLDLTTNPPTVSVTIPCGSDTSLNFIAITPDPAPAADFTATIGNAGAPTNFDASSSATGVGTIVTYAWNFGDGTQVTTSNPQISHTYATAGSFNAELTVTNSAGTSVTQTFTGQTVSNAGSYDNAHITKSINIPTPPTPPQPPPCFYGKLHKHHHHLLLRTEWSSSPSQNVAAYEVYENSRLISTDPNLFFSKMLHPRKFFKHHLNAYKKYLEKRYKVRAVNSSGLQSDFTSLEIG